VPGPGTRRCAGPGRLRSYAAEVRAIASAVSMSL
jgi:hypothetical protein